MGGSHARHAGPESAFAVVEAKLVEGPFHCRCGMLKNPNCSMFEVQSPDLCLKPFSCNSDVAMCENSKEE